MYSTYHYYFPNAIMLFKSFAHARRAVVNGFNDLDAN